MRAHYCINCGKLLYNRPRCIECGTLAAEYDFCELKPSTKAAETKKTDTLVLDQYNDRQTLAKTTVIEKAEPTHVIDRITSEPVPEPGELIEKTEEKAEISAADILIVKVKAEEPQPAAVSEEKEPETIIPVLEETDIKEPETARSEAIEEPLKESISGTFDEVKENIQVSEETEMKQEEAEIKEPEEIIEEVKEAEEPVQDNVSEEITVTEAEKPEEAEIAETEEKQTVSEESKPETMICPECGMILPVQARFCMYCGHNFLSKSSAEAESVSVSNELETPEEPEITAAIEPTVNPEQPETIEQPAESDHSDYTESSYEINIDKYVDTESEPEKEELVFEAAAVEEPIETEPASEISVVSNTPEESVSEEIAEQQIESAEPEPVIITETKPEIPEETNPVQEAEEQNYDAETTESVKAEETVETESVTEVSQTVEEPVLSEQADQQTQSSELEYEEPVTAIPDTPIGIAEELTTVIQKPAERLYEPAVIEVIGAAVPAEPEKKPSVSEEVIAEEKPAEQPVKEAEPEPVIIPAVPVTKPEESKSAVHEVKESKPEPAPAKTEVTVEKPIEQPIKEVEPEPVIIPTVPVTKPEEPKPVVQEVKESKPEPAPVKTEVKEEKPAEPVREEPKKENIVCPTCGEVFPSVYPHCPYCGTTVIREPKKPEPQPVIETTVVAENLREPVPVTPRTALEERKRERSWVEVSEEQAKKITCPRCNSLVMTSSFCPVCGYDLKKIEKKPEIQLVLTDPEAELKKEAAKPASAEVKQSEKPKAVQNIPASAPVQHEMIQRDIDELSAEVNPPKDMVRLSVMAVILFVLMLLYFVIL
ncbi:MAG: zinc ribbon domain-containing protein [Erysipelotrichaceae bacterium]|nr:zinc ribbon domain-containing protein [Erysipelotrichaceae bacterium]